MIMITSLVSYLLLFLKVILKLVDQVNLYLKREPPVRRASILWIVKKNMNVIFIMSFFTPYHDLYHCSLYIRYDNPIRRNPDNIQTKTTNNQNEQYFALSVLFINSHPVLFSTEKCTTVQLKFLLN